MDEREKDLGNEIWRLGQRVLEVLAQVSKLLNKHDADTERAQQRGWVIDAKLGGIETELGHLKRAVAELEKAVKELAEAVGRKQGSGMLNDVPPYVKVVLYGLAAALTAVAAGKVLIP